MTLSTGIALSPIWLRGEAWRRDDSRVEEMFSLSPYTELAQKAEAAALDFLFWLNQIGRASCRERV